MHPITLATLLAGDTPQPVTTTRLVPGTTDLLLVDSNNRQLGQRLASFQRIVTPEQPAHLTLFGIDTGLPSVMPAELENLYVNVVIDGDNVRFNPHELALAYGREIPGIATFDDAPPARIPALIPATPEERRLAHNLRVLGHSDLHIQVALQQLRNSESDGDAFVAALREQGLSRDQIRALLRELRQARRFRPYTPPTSGLLLEVFPDLASARASEIVYPAASALDGTSIALASSETVARATAAMIVTEIRTIDPDYVPTDFSDPTLFPHTVEARIAHIDRLRGERAAILFRIRGEVQSLQIETIRFLQTRAGPAYERALVRLHAGELDIRRGAGDALGKEIDKQLRHELREFYQDLGVSTDGELVRINRRAYVTVGAYRIPDVVVGDMFIDLSLSQKQPSDDQIVDFFNTQSRPRYVVIVRPPQAGQTYVITPPRSRHPRG
jgi:hypothetical protein